VNGIYFLLLLHHEFSNGFIFSELPMLSVDEPFNSPAAIEFLFEKM